MIYNLEQGIKWVDGAVPCGCMSVPHRMNVLRVILSTLRADDPAEPVAMAMELTNTNIIYLYIKYAESIRLLLTQ